MTTHPQERDIELAPCPFCDSPAELERDNDHHGPWFNLGCSRHWGRVDPDIACPGGRLWYTEPQENEAKAIAAWNLRAQPSTREVALEKEWRCYHCDEVFTNEEDASAHFGYFTFEKPGCLAVVEDGVGDLLRRIYKLEGELARYRAEDSDADRLYHKLVADHVVALRREEERGYERGLADGSALSPAQKGEAG